MEETKLSEQRLTFLEVASNVITVANCCFTERGMDAVAGYSGVFYHVMTGVRS